MFLRPKWCYFTGTCRHTQLPSCVWTVGTFLIFNMCILSCVCLCMFRVISSLQRQMVMADFTPDFRRKLQDFYKKFYFPAAQRNLRNRCVCTCIMAAGPLLVYVSVCAYASFVIRTMNIRTCCVSNWTWCVSACVSVLGMTYCWCLCWRGRMCRASGKTEARRMSWLKRYL